MSLTTNQRNTIQTWLAAADTKIDTYEATFFAANGRYRQFKRSHTIPPQNATAVLPDNLTDQPTNETNGQTLTMANGGAGWPCSVTVDVYQSPGGWGYTKTYRARGSTGEVWRIVRNVGPETWRAQTLAQEPTGIIQ